MKKLISTLLCVFSVAGLSDAGTALKLDNLNLRPDDRLIYNNPTSGVGLLKAQPGYAVNGVQNENPIEVRLRWTELDLDGEGVANDYIDFTLRATPSKTTVVTWDGLGWGDSFGLSEGEGITFTVIDVKLSAKTIGAISFRGFTSAGIQGTNFKDKQYGFTADIGGLKISGSDTDPSPPHTMTYNLPNNSFMIQELIFNNVKLRGLNDSICARNFDLEFSYVKVPEPTLR